MRVKQSDFSIVVDDGPDIRRIESSNPLEPGQYWRVKKEGTARSTGSFPRDVKLREGDIHLITKLFDFEGVLHSVTFLGHPRDTNKSNFTSFIMLALDFFAAFDPVPLDEAKAVRSSEQAQIMARVQAMQQEMMDAQVNPLQIPGVQSAADEAAERFEHEEAVRTEREVSERQKKESDLRRIHRRAARRSDARGNPLVVRKATISDRLDVMISEGVTSDGVRDLQIEAGRRQAIAEASAKWLTNRAQRMAEVIGEIAPYAAEQGQLALAMAGGAIDRVKEISAGIASLKLYTGDGVEVFAVSEGENAPSNEPLTIVQGKVAMDEEMALHVDVEDSFDWHSQEAFFKRLATDDELLRQILPTPRCVVSVMVTRREIDYGEKMHPYDRLVNKLNNQRVFLLVRNGRNVHAVYSSEPSHEAAVRLFPTRQDIKAPFQGINGVVGLNDVAFSKAAGQFEDQALHYRRFLILLCGLDHRLNLFGDFAPIEAKVNFMTEEFQQVYLRFLENDDPSMLLGGRQESVHAWMKRHNSQLRSGSRVVVDSSTSLASAVPYLRKNRDAYVDHAKLDGNALIAVEKLGNLYLSVPLITEQDKAKQGNAWLSGPERYESPELLLDWYLCIDRVKVDEVRAYLYDRYARVGSIAWIRTLRRVERTLVADAQAEQVMRSHVRGAALDAGIQSEATIDTVIDGAVATWRADHRGAPAPVLADKKGMAELLSLIFPASSIAASMEPLISALCAKESLQPLMATRTGKNKLALYCVVSEEERKPYGTGVVWGWVKRYVLQVNSKGAKLGYSSMDWLMAKTLESTEEAFLRWPELKDWVHEKPEPIKLSTLLKAKQEVEAGNILIQQLHDSRIAGVGLDHSMLRDWVARIRESSGNLTYTQHFYLSIPIAVYQRTKNAPPKFAYARINFIDMVRHYGTTEQMQLVLNTRGMRSAEMRNRAKATESVSWAARCTKTMAPMWLQREAELGDSAAPSWWIFKSHEKGGRSRKSFSFCPPFGKRVKSSTPYHNEHHATLSWNRAIDSLMGIQPLQERAFYRSVKERVSHIFGISEPERVARERKAEKERRFESKAPVAVEVASCLFDARLGRAMANRFFSGKLSVKS